MIILLLALPLLIYLTCHSSRMNTSWCHQIFILLVSSLLSTLGPIGFLGAGHLSTLHDLPSGDPPPGTGGGVLSQTN